MLEERTLPHDAIAEYTLSRCRDVENCPDEMLAPYQEFVEEGKVYYFTPGEFLYRKDPGTEEAGGYFCGYLTNEVWHYRTDDG